MQEAYWTYCLYCHRMICVVEVLDDYPDVVVRYAHRTCHEERSPVDPQATWEMLCDALQELDVNRNDVDARARAIELLDSLARWLRMGGVPPNLEPEMEEMDLQDWLDELLSQLAAAEPDRAIIIECLQRLLGGAALGEPLPRVEEGTC
jgi:hypothetical protein